LGAWLVYTCPFYKLTYYTVFVSNAENGLMDKLPIELQLQFFKVYSEEISIEDFEQWLYGETELEKLVGEKYYLDLVSLNFKDRHIKHEMSKVIDSFLDFGLFEERKLKKILNDLINRTHDFAKSLIATYDLYCSGYNFFDNLGMGYGLIFANDFFDYNDWTKLTENQKNQRIEIIFGGVKKEAGLVLEWINSGKIILTGEVDEIDHYEYIDKRTEAERKLRTIETIETKEIKLRTIAIPNKGVIAKLKGWFS
tara:strand:+ start:103510 stop:104268 length:759 start_codon:yes stop_codon:yes gene_type:complete